MLRFANDIVMLANEKKELKNVLSGWMMYCIISTRIIGIFNTEKNDGMMIMYVMMFYVIQV